MRIYIYIYIYIYILMTAWNLFENRKPEESGIRKK